MGRKIRIAASMLAIAGIVALGGCRLLPDGADPVRTLPPAGADFDYQLGGAYDPPSGVEVVARDSTEDPASGVYNICYVNGFQTQPGEGERWLADYPALVLREVDGEPVADPGWPDEYLLDTSTVGKRAAIAHRFASVLSSCDERGFDAVEIDNLDSWSRSNGALTLDDNIALAALFADRSHALGLAIAQKNGAGESQRLRDEVGFDFAVVEQCMRFSECDGYFDAYDGLVLDIEYPDESADGDAAEAFRAACAEPGRPESMILRDLGLAPAGDPAYVRETC
ncbi:MAG: endo alpha-1,4 polygalactosaminidase [Pseudolysinimonas sp.]